MADQENIQSIIIISGPPGAGKTTFSRHLVALATKPTVYIEGDSFFSHIVKSDPADEKHKQFRGVMRAMVVASIAYAVCGYETILDFSIPPWYLEPIHKLLGSRPVAVNYVVLLPDEAVCAQRAAAREHGAIEDYTKLHEFYNTFKDVKNYIDYNGQDAAALAPKVWEDLASGKFKIY